MNKYLKSLFILVLLISIISFSSASLTKTASSGISINPNSVQTAIGDYVQVYNTGGTGVVVRDPNGANACGTQIANEPDGAKGTVTSSMQYCNSYDRVKVRFSDGVEGWVALYYLQGLTMPFSFKFNINDRIYVPSGNVNVRGSPFSSPVLNSLGSQPTNAQGTIVSASFYGVPQSSSGFFYFWNVNFDTGTSGWVAQDYIEKYIPPTQCTPNSGPCCDGAGNFISSSNVCQQDVTTEYGCPWGTSCGVNSGLRHQDRYCSGSSASCNGALQYDSWAVSDYCSSSEICQAGNSQCVSSASCNPQQCTPGSGACCDSSGNFRGTNFLCGPNAQNTFSCAAGSCGNDVLITNADQYCSGNAVSCNGALVWKAPVVYNDCPSTQICANQGGTYTCVNDVSCQPTQQCTSGVCCDTSSSTFRPSSYQCASWANYSCSSSSCGGNALIQQGTQFCSGSSANCDTPINWGSWTVNQACTSTQTCQNGNPTYCAEQQSCQVPTQDYNSPFITDAQLEDYLSMSEQQIRDFLTSHNSYFKQQINDVDGVSFDPSATIYQAAQTYKINPKILLTTLEKESVGVSTSTRPSDTTMRFLMGCISQTTARQQLICAAERFRSYHNSLKAGGSTVSGWKAGIAKQTLDGVSVTPATNAVAGQFTYTPYVGYQWGGNDPRWGGVYLFYHYWNSFGFNTQQVSSCGDTVSQSMVLYNDITGCTGTGLSISNTAVNAGNSIQSTQTNNLVLDCNGHSIQGANGLNGIYIDGTSNIEIRNCAISGFGANSIVLDNTANDIISNNNLSGGNGGIYSNVGTNISIINNNISNTGFGIMCDVSNQNTIQNNYLSNNPIIGIQISTGSNNSVSENNLYNEGNGVGLIGVNYNNVQNNEVSGSVVGITIGTSNYNLLSGNNLDNNAHFGFYIEQSDNNIIQDNKANNNGYSGMYVITSSDSNEIKNNEMYANEQRGLYISSSSSNQIWNNKFADNVLGNAYDDYSAKSPQGYNFWNYNSVGNLWDDFKSNPGYPIAYNVPGGTAVDNSPREPVCGDINNDGVIDVLDVIGIINVAFRGESGPYPSWIGDLNGDGSIDVIDVSLMINHAFRGAPAPTCTA